LFAGNSMFDIILYLPASVCEIAIFLVISFLPTRSIL
jgi:hypothetical protein